VAKNKTKETNDKIVYVGEIVGYLGDHIDLPAVIKISFVDNGGMVVTLGNQQFLPNAQDLMNTREAVENLGKILEMDLKKIIVGSWMDRKDPKKRISSKDKLK